MTKSRAPLLLVIAGALAGYVAWSGNSPFSGVLQSSDTRFTRTAPVKGSQVTENVQPSAKRPLTNPLKHLKATDFSETVRRPLFRSTRRPLPTEPTVEPMPEPATPETEAAPVTEDVQIDPADFALLAVSSYDGQRVAVVRQNSLNQTFHVREGEDMSGLRVISVGDREITIGKDGQSLAISMFATPSAAPTDAGVNPDAGDAPNGAAGGGTDEMPVEPAQQSLPGDTPE
jgi:hypothetical protein